ncbi:MAG: hypothetical protein ABJN40_16450 [Sneathiella sp.]
MQSSSFLASSRQPVRSVFFSTLMGLFALPATGYASICETELKNALTQIDLSGKTASQTTYVNYAGNNTGGSTTDSADSWTSFKECTGNLVIRVSSSCFIDVIYTTGACKIRDVSDY